ncbi:MAG TPA: ankyrin repeat domain-containing protein [Gaiellaceae bacterium]|nr:ankyrin repeat domain-containing protein [Gaiellaceae bacterium]
MTASLPAAPSLEQLRKQAKDLLRAHRAGEATAAARLAAHHPRPDEPLKLAGAQLVVAREHGFPSWPRLRAYVERVAAHGPELQHAYHEDLEYYEGRAYGLRASAEDGTEGAAAAFRRWDAPLTERGARTVVARQHGFSTWAGLRRHVASLRESGEPFARAFRAVEAHDLEALRAELDRFPDLVAARGTNDNDLLGMAGGDERLVALLLERGADPSRGNAHGWTPLHQAAYGNDLRLARILLGEGVPVDVPARGDGGTPLVVALFWGNREAAELLAEHGLAPANLRVAAGLGRLDLIDELVPAGGRVAPEAGAHRGFYRPHSGFPAWHASDDPQQVLDEALAWAARNDRVDALDVLVARGAAVDADVNRGTALAWAAACGRTGAVRRLLALGADPNARTTFGGPEHGDGTTALHHAAETGRLEAIEALLDAGADPTVRDAFYDGTPARWAEHNRRHATVELLRKRGG